MEQPIIQVQDLRKVYRVGSEQVVALDRINFEVLPGQVCCIVGTSGSGKSTLLNQLAGLEKPSRGQVLIDGRNISSFSEQRLARFRQKKIGFIFQSYNLMPSLTALENVTMPLVFRGVSKVKRNKAAKRILKEVGLSGRIKHRPSQMSGGQQQRVGIARAFVARPKLVFADEPTGNLDSRTTIEVMRMMVRLCRENSQTLILVTHDVELAQYADRVITLIDGNIVKDELNQSIADALSDQEHMDAYDESVRAAREETDAVPGPAPDDAGASAPDTFVFDGGVDLLPEEDSDKEGVEDESNPEDSRPSPGGGS